MINTSTDQERLDQLSNGDKNLLRQLWVIKASTLRDLGGFYPFEEIRNLLVRLPIDDGVFPFFISHRWESPINPDPMNFKYDLLLSSPKFPRRGQNEAYFWYDYSCAPQKRNNNVDIDYFNYIITGITHPENFEI